jgi:hypothetical protein
MRIHTIFTATAIARILAGQAKAQTKFRRLTLAAA